jgi:hypothetical protein
MSLLKHILALSLLAGLTVSCSKEKEPTYLKEELLALAPAEGADKVDVVLARDINDAVPCADYGDGCLSAHRFRTRDLNFIAVEFETPGQAENAAKKIYAWTARNWLLDDVDGEPLLERWASEHLKATSHNPQKKNK